MRAEKRAAFLGGKAKSVSTTSRVLPTSQRSWCSAAVQLTGCEAFGIATGTSPGGVVTMAAGGTERRDCREELAAMVDRGHADPDQVVGRQLARHLGGDIVVAERRLTL